MRGPRLGEADTTVRVQTVWRVVAEEVAPDHNRARRGGQQMQGLEPVDRQLISSPRAPPS